MFKKIMLILAIIIGLVLLLGGLGVYYFKPGEDKVLHFIKDHPAQSAILLLRNDSIVAARNLDKQMPLASTVKIIIAIEYAVQAGAGKINPDSLVALADLERLHVPDTDGGAHPGWLQSVKDSIQNNRIALREIAKGMIAYSSNANTEWLLNELGIDNVNNRLDSLGLQQHSPIYNIVSALFVGKELFPGVNGKNLVDKLNTVSTTDYIAATERIHKKLLADTAYKMEPGDLGLEIQRIWSDRLPASTVRDYVAVMKKINSRTYFDAATQSYLDDVMEYILDNPANREWLQHSGMKGGSTAFVLTKALYATDKKGNKTELAYFFNNLTPLEMTRLELSMNDFELQLLSSKAFREKVKEVLAE